MTKTAPKPTADGSLLMVRMGRVNVKMRRGQMHRLPMVNEVFTSTVNGRLVDFGPQNRIPPDYLRDALEWSTVPAEDYVLPTDCHKAEQIRQALRYFGVEEATVLALRTAAGLRRELDTMKLKMDTMKLDVDELQLDLKQTRLVLSVSNAGSAAEKIEFLTEHRAEFIEIGLGNFLVTMGIPLS